MINPIINPITVAMMGMVVGSISPFAAGLQRKEG